MKRTMITIIIKNRIMRAALPFLTLSFLLLSVSSCSRLFDPETDDQIKESEYISSNTELYTGFIGIMTKVQAVGDKEILLTDTRAELLEPTMNATTELYNIYNYADNLQGNSYANPAGYYEVIVACNDYLAKVFEYRTQPQVDQQKCDNLIASTIRVKVWAYKTLGEIYGEAAWFDEPIGSVDAFLASGYELIGMEQIADKCLNLLEQGYKGVAADGKINWIEWLDPEHINDIANSPFRKWDYMVPAYEGLYAELCLWKAAYLDGAGDNPSAKPYYKAAADILLAALNTEIDNEGHSGNNPYWCPNAGTAGRYANLWLAEDPYAPENVSVILYDYENKQINSLVKHFCADADYLLAPAEGGEHNFLDKTKNPGATTSETRYKNLIGNSGGNRYIAKFRGVGGRNGVRQYTYQDDVHIYVYRATQYHLMLCEALNNLARFTSMGCVLNKGITGANQVDLVASDQDVKEGKAPNPEWEGFTRNWTTDAEWGTRKYPCAGVRGAFSLDDRVILTTQDASLNEAKKHNDIEIMREVILEHSCEGKTYPWMNRLAVRYNDLSIIADEVCPKYEFSGQAEAIRAKILDGGNWVKYELTK